MVADSVAISGESIGALPPAFVREPTTIPAASARKCSS
jgi:hypothetical protein